MSHQLRVTVTQWLRSNGYNPATAGLVVYTGRLIIPRAVWDNALVAGDAKLIVRRE
ncbi:hypothetical protein ACT3R2_17745 [Halomonas sp. AOP43-D1-39]|uniref:hypothetical protein n=1 Tax=unclassified Halomonas TaxID=2609666 RepID=UPI004033F029